MPAGVACAGPLPLGSTEANGTSVALSSSSAATSGASQVTATTNSNHHRRNGLLNPVDQRMNVNQVHFLTHRL